VIIWVLIGWKVIHWQGEAVGKKAVNDFVEYWAAAHLLLTGNNPYSPEQLFAVQQAAGWTEESPLLMWNPPWTLSFILPFGLVRYPTGKLLWLILNFAIVVICAHWTWRLYDGAIQHYWLAWLVSFTFLPTVVVLIMGQITPFILLGVVSFLYLEKHAQWWAGACLALIAMKPQLLYLFWLALLLWVMDQRRWTVLLGAGLAIAAATIIPLIFNPNTLVEYVELYKLANQLPFDWATPTLGTLLSLTFGLQRYWLNFLPTIGGILWFLVYWRRRRAMWNWANEIPLLILVSLATTPHAFSYDQVILLPVLIQTSVWILKSRQLLVASLGVMVHLIINGIALFLNISRVWDFWYIWMVPTLLLGYLSLKKQINYEAAQLTNQPQ
jgi:hypothetical protein